MNLATLALAQHQSKQFFLNANPGYEECEKKRFLDSNCFQCEKCLIRSMWCLLIKLIPLLMKTLTILRPKFQGLHQARVVYVI